MFSKKEIVTYNWTHPARISESAKSTPSNIRGKIYRMNSEHGRKIKESSFGFFTKRVQGTTSSENRRQFFKPIFLRVLQLRRKREFTLDSEASLHTMSTSDLTPEEQETMQKSKDPTVILTTKDATGNVCDLDMSVQGTNCAKNSYFYEWHPGQPSYLIKNGRTTECKTDTRIPLVVPGVQATEHQTDVMGDRKHTEAVGDQERRLETELASTVHGRMY